MERTFIQEFQNLQVLTSLSLDRMDELVQDLTNALEETSRSQIAVSTITDQVMRRQSRARRNRKRRSNPANGRTLADMSEASESSLEEVQRNSLEAIAPLSDSDDVAQTCLTTSWKNNSCNHAESDSVNENFSPIRPHRRRRKFRRMAVDPDPNSEIPVTSQKLKVKTKIVPHTQYSSIELSKVDIENIKLKGGHFGFDITSGKRKRWMREKSVDNFDSAEICSRVNQHLTLSPCNKQILSKMDCSNDESSCSLTSESDPGIYTNDEGREADDEQSDFFHEPGPACGIPGIRSWWDSQNLEDDEATDPKFQEILSGCFPLMSSPGRKAYRTRLKRLKGKRPGMNTLVNSSEKISQFLENPHQKELYLQCLKKQERDQLMHLASLYSLDLKINDPKFSVLSKTRDTTTLYHGNAILGGNQSIEIKRRRKTPPTNHLIAGYIADNAPCIPESNIGNRMLQNMGWTPGSGLGLDGTGIQSPLLPQVRRKRQGLGHPG